MRVSSLIVHLQEVLDRYGDLNVLVGERSSQTVARVDLCVDSSESKGNGDDPHGKVAILQAYHVFGKEAR